MGMIRAKVYAAQTRTVEGGRVTIRRRDEQLDEGAFAPINLRELLAEVYDLLPTAQGMRLDGTRRSDEVEYPTVVHGVVDLATGRPRRTRGVKLFDNGVLGADLLDVPPNAGFPVHVHPGHHMLLCLRGTGTFSLAGVVHEVGPGDLYLVESAVPHAVGAGPQGHTLVAIGAPPRPLDAVDRMTVVDWDGMRVEAPSGLVEEAPTERALRLAVEVDARARLDGLDLTPAEVSWLETRFRS